jgi:hypothetical protein
MKVLFHTRCRNPSLGPVTNVKACKVVGQEGSLGITPHAPMSVKECEGMNPHIPKGVSTLGVEVPMDSQIFRRFRVCRGQNSMDWRVFYIIEKLLERRCLKWACMTHLDIWNTSYGQKKSQELNWQFDSRPLKVRNRPNFLACRWHATYCWKALNEGYNFSLVLISIKGRHTKLWGPKFTQVPTLGILGQNAIWMWASWRNT